MSPSQALATVLGAGDAVVNEMTSPRPMGQTPLGEEGFSTDQQVNRKSTLRALERGPSSPGWQCRAGTGTLLSFLPLA